MVKLIFFVLVRGGLRVLGWERVLGLLSLGVIIRWFIIPEFNLGGVREVIFLDGLRRRLVILRLWILIGIILSGVNREEKNFFLFLRVSLCLLIILAFIFSNLLGFYLIFEGSLIPILLIVLGWGGQPERLRAGFYIIIYTIISSFSLIVIVFIFFSEGRLEWGLIKLRRIIGLRKWWWILVLIPFFVKIPMYGVHLWLPKAHVEAPVFGSIVLAGVLLKLGGYGLIRMVRVAREESIRWICFIGPFSLIGGGFTRLICIRQVDIKALIAYSSVGHIRFVISAVILGLRGGLTRRILVIIAHGIVSSGLFALAGVFYDLYGRRAFILIKGGWRIFRYTTIFWVFLIVGNIAAPPRLNIIGEIFSFNVLLNYGNFFIFLFLLLIFFRGVYSLILFRRVSHGYIREYKGLGVIEFLRRRWILGLIHVVPAFFIIWGLRWII